jgi:hypothetical protein
MLPIVKLQDVVDAMAGAMDGHSYYLKKRTVEIILVSEEEMEAAEEDEPLSEYPAWQQDSILVAREIMQSPDEYVALPDQFDVHEYKIMQDFCNEIEDRSVGKRLNGLIKGSGAFRRFKNAVREFGLDDEWSEFRQREFEHIAVRWLEENGIAYTTQEDTSNE